MKKGYQNDPGRRPAGWRRRLLIVLLSLLIAGALTFCGLLGAVLAGSHDEIRGDPQVIIVLGGQVKEDGPSVLLRNRLDKALGYMEDHPDAIVVVSGGKGENEPFSEARGMADYLMAHGVAEEQILLEDQSHNTAQNMRFSAQLLTEREIDLDQDILVVSNGFHLTRARMLWGRVWGDKGRLSTLAAPCEDLPACVWMHIREPLALVKSFFLD